MNALKSLLQLITAIACLQLAEQKRIDLDGAVHDILPQLRQLEDAQGNKTPITLRHLLTHTAGMSYPFFNKDAKRYVRTGKGVRGF